MNTPNIPPPLPPARTERPQGTLEERIALAEDRLVARQQALQHGAQALVLRARAALEPGRMVRTAAYTLGGLTLVWVAVRLLGRRPRAEETHTDATSAGAPSAPTASRSRKVPWERAAALIWPLLPVAWRGRLGPDAASILVTVCLALAGLLFGGRGRTP